MICRHRQHRLPSPYRAKRAKKTPTDEIETKKKKKEGSSSSFFSVSAELDRRRSLQCLPPLAGLPIIAFFFGRALAQSGTLACLARLCIPKEHINATDRAVWWGEIDRLRGKTRADCSMFFLFASISKRKHALFRRSVRAAERSKSIASLFFFQAPL